LLTADGGFAMDTSVFTSANTTGVISWVPTTTTSNAAVLDGTTLTSGTLLKMVAVDATLAAGYYMEVFGGTNATVVWTVGEGGATRITPNVNTIEPLYIDGILTSTADLLTLRADDDVLNGGLFLEVLGGASYDTSQFSIAEGGVVTALGDSTFTGGLNTGTGYSGTGATISAAGAGSFDALITGALGITVSGANAALDGGMSMDSTVFVLTDTTGAISWVATNTDCDAFLMDGITTTSGTILKMRADDDVLNAGFYVEVLGGSSYDTEVWSLKEDGATRITPGVGTTEPLYVDGILSTSADLLTLRADDDVLNGGLFVECLGGASYDTSQFSIGEGGAVYILGATTQVGEWQAGGGYGSTGATISVAGVGQFNGALTTDGALTADSAAIGGGYGSTGASLSTAGVGQFNGALTTDGALTADNIVCTNAATFGGGYGSTGATISTAGVVQANGTLTVDGASTLTGALTSLVTATETVSGATDTITSANYGTTIFYTQAGGVTVTLPANGAAIGSWFRCINANSDTTAPTYTAATVDTLITFNDAQADSVTFGSGHRIGSSVIFISNGTYWVAINESGSNTMTVNT
jgi:hypothetical protein